MNSLHIALLLIKRVLSRKRSVFGNLILPALLIILAISLISGDNETQVKLVTVNLDQGPLGAVFLKDWERNPQFILHASAGVQEAMERVAGKEADLMVIVPAAFTDNILSGKPAGLEINQQDYNGAMSLAEPAARSMAGQLAAALEELQGAGAAGPQELLERISAMYKDKWDHSPAFKETRHRLLGDQRLVLSTGLLVLFILTLVSSGMSIVMDDRRNRTLQRMYASPVSELQIAAGHILGCLFLGTLQITFVLVVPHFFMGGVPGIGFFSHWLVMECFLVAALGVTSAVAGFARNPENSGALNMLVITPTCMLGGCFWPLDVMPDSMQKLANFVPQKWALEAVAMLSRGTGLPGVRLHLAILLLFGIVLLSFGTSVLRPGEEA